MKKMRFDEFLKVVEYAPITPMQALELFHLLYKYMEAVKRYNEADTNEKVALARWGLDDSRNEYERFRRKLNCGIPSLLYIHQSIY